MKAEIQKPYKLTPVVRETQKLVQIPSVTGSEQKGQEFLAQSLHTWAKTLPADSGFSLFMQDVPNHTAQNLITRVPGNAGKGSSRAIIFTGHVDTVTPGGIHEEWVGRSPWSGEIVAEEGTHNLYGVGSTDMKSGLVAGEFAFRELAEKAAAGNLDADLFFVSVTEEETSGAGSSAFAKWFQEEKYPEKYTDGVVAIIGEPRDTGNRETEIGIGCRGNAFLKLEKQGSSLHSGEVAHNSDGTVLGNLADEVFALQQDIHTLDSQWQEKDSGYGFPMASITITGGSFPQTNYNSTPGGEGNLTLDTRFLDNSVLQDIAHLAEKHGFSLSQFETAGPSAKTDQSDPLVQAFLYVLSENGKTATPKVVPSSNDAGFLDAAGIITVVIGPGIQKLEHVPNEYVTTEAIDEAVGLYVQASLKWIEMTNSVNQI